MPRVKDYREMLADNGLLLSAELTPETAEAEVTGLTYDSRESSRGTLFVCKGAHFVPGYLTDALARGAIAYVAERAIPEAGEAPCLLVSDIRKAMAVLGNAFYGEAWRNLRLVGVTGTKGKSTTTYYIKQILDRHQAARGGEPCAILSGIDVEDGVIREESHLTTPEAMMLHRHFRHAADSGREFLVMEVSSQALKYDRTLGVIFTVGIFLNIGEDHISPIEHTDFDDYFQSKLRLFEQSETSCVNLDAAESERVLAAASGKTRLVTFGSGAAADIRVRSMEARDGGIDFSVETPEGTYPFRLSMTGLFNVENALAAIAACRALGVSYETMGDAFRTAAVPGRMETFLGARSKALVIVDYAHNRMSFERLFESTAREYPERSIVAVFGCPGKKALARRRELAEVAARYARKIFITEEDAGEEPVLDISREIAGWVEAAGCPYEIVLDRGEAIKKAIGEADGKTVVLLTGKGRETRQKRGTDYIDCPSDVDYVLQFLE